MSQKVFINYRKEDSPWNSIALYTELVKHFPEENIFKDFNTIKPGHDFVESIEEALQTCDVLLVLISEKWLEMKDKNGNRRIDNPDDFVRIEIATALKRKIPVIPILFDGAVIPPSDELPEDLKALSRRQSVAMDRMRFEGDALNLVEAIKNINIYVTSQQGEVKSLPKSVNEQKEEPSKETEEEPSDMPPLDSIEDIQERLTLHSRKNFYKILLLFAAAIIFAIIIIKKNHSDSPYNPSPSSKIDSATTESDTEKAMTKNNNPLTFETSPLRKSGYEEAEEIILSLPNGTSITEGALKSYYGDKYREEPYSIKELDGLTFDYKGNIEKGKPNGYGIAEYSDASYLGEFKNGMPEGKGVFISNSGEKYIGELKRGMKDGKGTCTYSNGDKYSGEWKDALANGKGICIWKAGNKYIGEWENGEMSGYGEFYIMAGNKETGCPGCAVYKGYWKNGLKSGSGKCYDKHGNVLYDGPFKNDLPVNKYPGK